MRTAEHREVSPKLDISCPQEVFSENLILADLSDYPIDDPLRLLQSKVAVRVYDTPTVAVYSLYFPELTLKNEELVDVLSYTRPNTNRSDYYTQRRSGVIADWVMPDKIPVPITRFDRLRNQTRAQLLPLHEGLGGDWEEFNKYHRKRFLKAVVAQPGIFLSVKECLAILKVVLNVDRYAFDASRYGDLVPWILWAKSKDTAQRTYISSTPPPTLAKAVDSRANTLLGLVVATYLSPEQRAKLPEKMRLKGSNKEQVRKLTVYFGAT